jgi:hypothetical protein
VLFGRTEQDEGDDGTPMWLVIGASAGGAAALAAVVIVVAGVVAGGACIRRRRMRASRAGLGIMTTSPSKTNEPLQAPAARYNARALGNGGDL